MNTVMDTMTPSYPEIADNRERILRVAINEEKAFLKTLESGTKLFDEAVDDLRSTHRAKTHKVLSGDKAFELHDTYGFPIDLTLEMAQEAGLDVDMEGFNAAMGEQRRRAKADNQAKKHGHTDLSLYRDWVDNNPTVFTGYEELASGANVIGLVKDGQKVNEVHEGDEVEVILDYSPLYAESGGQMADRGRISAGESLVEVNDVQKIGKKLWVHKASVIAGGLDLGMSVEACVDEKWRHGATQAHSATHLIHAALRQVLGPTAVQAGSLNRPGYLRFDFNYTEQLNQEQLEEIALITNQAIDSNLAVNTTETSLEEAKAMGAMALFGENYGNQVRVVEIGGPFSIELCGGTHVSSSAEIGPVSVLGESSVGSGARRIEAYSGMDAFRYYSKETALIEGVSRQLKVQPEELPERVSQLAERLKAAEKEIEGLRKAQLTARAAEIIDSAIEINGIKTITLQLPDGTSGGDLRTVATDIRNRMKDTAAVIVLGAVDKGKFPFIAAVTGKAVDQGVKAGKIVKRLGEYVNGRGGGKPDMAQGSGTAAEGAQRGFEAVKDLLQSR